jgi:glycosyltransferase involved in cell wall biosynthesis
VTVVRPRLLHVITSLSTGGAEVMLRNIVLGEPSREFDLRVISLTTFDPIGKQIAAAGIPTMALGAQRGFLGLQHWRQLRNAVVDWRPDLIHSWMYHANAAMGVVLRTVPAPMRSRHVAAIRAAASHAKAQSQMTQLVRRVDAMLSSRFDGLIFNAVASRDQHRRLGYNVERAVVIPNGFDTDRFRPVPEWRAATRHDLGVSNEPLVGIVARYHPVKGHRYFIESAAAVAKRGLACKFVLVGAGCDADNVELRKLLEQHGIADRTVLLGERSDVERVLNAMDVAVCASISESFPNAVGEAMACGVLCVVTQVGDCEHLLGDTGWIVPIADASAMSAAIGEAISLPKPAASARALRARERIREHFSLKRVIEQYWELYTSILASRGTH